MHELSKRDCKSITLIQIRTNPYKLCAAIDEPVQSIWFLWRFFSFESVQSVWTLLWWFFFIWIRTNPHKVCAIMQQRGDQSRSRPSSPSSSSWLFSKTFLFFYTDPNAQRDFWWKLQRIPNSGSIFLWTFRLSCCKVLGSWTKVAIGTRWSEADKSQTTIMAQKSKITLKLVYLKYLIALVQNLEVKRGQWETISNRFRSQDHEMLLYSILEMDSVFTYDWIGNWHCCVVCNRHLWVQIVERTNRRCISNFFAAKM